MIRETNIVKIQILTPEQQERFLRERFLIAKKDKERLEGEWQSNEVTIYDVGEEGGALRYGGENTFEGFSDADAEEPSKGGAEFMAINLVSRNKQLIHSQLCSNPPAVLAVPESSEEKDADAAISAEYITSYARTNYNLVNAVALATNSTFDYGTGFIKNVYDGAMGEIIEIKDDAIRMEGDNMYSVPSVWNMYLDPNRCNWIFERIFLTLEEAVHRFGEEHRKQLMKSIRNESDGPSSELDSSRSLLYDTQYNVIPILEYWETGLPENGFQGRLAYCLEDGYVLKPICPSPTRFKANPKNPESYKKARLPYSILTYIDLPNSPWGRSPAAHTSRQQEMLNNCVSVMISVAETVGTPKVLLPKNSVDKENVTNNPKDIWEYNATEGVPPYVIQAVSVSQDINTLMLKLEQFINDGWGVNDAMFGKQQREQSALLMQLSTMQGNMIRQRLFDKYVLFVQDMYELQLQYCVEYWEYSRLVKVVGENNTVQVRKLKGADIAGGYSIVVEYGQSFALDPITRGEQILKYSDLFMQAGMQPRELVKKLRLAELRSTYDEFKQADERAMEIIEKIKITKTQVPILSKYQDHIGIIAYMKKFTMDKAFEQLSPEVRELINQHLDMRFQVELENTAGQASGQMPMMPQPGMPMA